MSLTPIDQRRNPKPAKAVGHPTSESTNLTIVIEQRANSISADFTVPALQLPDTTNHKRVLMIHQPMMRN
jgi:hypothetical protein